MLNFTHQNVLKSSCFHEYWILHVLRFTDWTPFPYCWIRLCTVHGARGSMPCIILAFYLCTECLGISAVGRFIVQWYLRLITVCTWIKHHTHIRVFNTVVMECDVHYSGKHGNYLAVQIVHSIQYMLIKLS